jgi:hypothetical protein
MSQGNEIRSEKILLKDDPIHRVEQLLPGLKVAYENLRNTELFSSSNAKNRDFYA